PGRARTGGWSANARPSSAALAQQPLDPGLGILIVAFSYVTVATHFPLVHEHQGRPRAHAVATPDREIVILHDGIAHAELAGGLDDLAVALFPGKPRAGPADDREPRLLVPLVPHPQLRDD